MTVFMLIFLFYFLISSGFIYDFIIEPPALGRERDPKTGLWKQETIMKSRGQYIIEGNGQPFILFSSIQFDPHQISRCSSRDDVFSWRVGTDYDKSVK